MKKYLLSFLVLVLIYGCEKNELEVSSSLIGKWKFHTSAVTSLGADACNYRTTQSDLYAPSSLPPCRNDDVLKFSASGKLTFYYGSNKCTPYQPDNLVNTYQRVDSNLTIDGKPFKIVLFTQDTLIMDYCREINNSYPSLPPVGSGFAKIAEKYVRLK